MISNILKLFSMRYCRVYLCRYRKSCKLMQVLEIINTLMQVAEILDFNIGMLQFRYWKACTSVQVLEMLHINISIGNLCFNIGIGNLVPEYRCWKTCTSIQVLETSTLIQVLEISYIGLGIGNLFLNVGVGSSVHE